MTLSHVDIDPDARDLLAWLLRMTRQAADAAGFTGEWLPDELPASSFAADWRGLAGNAVELRRAAGQARRAGPDSEYNTLTDVWLLASAVEEATFGVARGDLGVGARRVHATVVADPRWAGKWQPNVDAGKVTP